MYAPVAVKYSEWIQSVKQQKTGYLPDNLPFVGHASKVVGPSELANPALYLHNPSNTFKNTNEMKLI